MLLRYTINMFAQDKKEPEKNNLNLILSGIYDAVIVVDFDRNITTFNQAAEAITGYKSQEVLGKPISDFMLLFDGEDLISEEIYAPVEIEYEEGLVFQREKLKLTTKRQKESFVNVMSGKVIEGREVNLGCIITLHDVTKEIQFEKTKLDFVAIAAHELRTPLTSVRGYLSVYINENKDHLNDDQKSLLSRASNAAQELNALIENLLNVSKIERNSFGVNLTAVDWVEFVKQAMQDFIDRANEKKIQLVFFEPNFKQVQVSADKLKIKEVVNNLLSNALNYTKEGGRVGVWMEQNGNEILTHVGDDGIGIPKSAMTNLFTKFFRVSGPLEKYSKGTGLGLYISKAIIDLHKGKIWVNSEEGKGSIFSFSLPVIK